jgi:hypothetical protein
VITFSSIWVFMKVGQLRWMGNKLSTYVGCWVYLIKHSSSKSCGEDLETCMSKISKPNKPPPVFA